MLSVKRSPARVCWWVVCNGICIATRNTKEEAEELKGSLSDKYGV